IDAVARVRRSRRLSGNARRELPIDASRHGARARPNAARERPELVHVSIAVVVDPVARLTGDERTPTSAPCRAGTPAVAGTRNPPTARAPSAPSTGTPAATGPAPATGTPSATA